MTTIPKNKQPKPGLLGHIRFTDTETTRTILCISESAMKKAQKGLLLSLLAIPIFILGYFNRSSSMGLLFLLLYISIVMMSYLIGGGLKKIFAIGAELIEMITIPLIFLNWSILLEIIIDLLLWILTIICFFLLPYFFLFLSFTKERRISIAAKKYLNE